MKTYKYVICIIVAILIALGITVHCCGDNDISVGEVAIETHTGAGRICLPVSVTETHRENTPALTKVSGREMRESICVNDFPIPQTEPTETDPKEEEPATFLSYEPELAEETETVACPDPTETMYFTEEDVICAAKVMYIECCNVPSITEQACVVWTMCNRVQLGLGNSIAEVVKAPYQYGYRESSPVLPQCYDIALDVLTRWNLEMNGTENVGRVLPLEYTYFGGDGFHNYFKNGYTNYSLWDYSLPSPYES